MNEITVAILSGLLIIVGIVGTLLPLLPGPPLSYVGLFIYAWYTKFDVVTPGWLWVFGILTLLTFLVDFILPAMGAKTYKSSKFGVWGSIIGGFAGVFVAGPIGAFLGPFVGGFIGEFIAIRDHEHALNAAWGAFLGMLVGTLFKFAVTLAMLIYFIVALF